MQMLFHIPNPVAERFKRAIPPKQRSAFITRLMENALPEDDDPLYHIALAVEQDEVLNAEMSQWRNGLIADGLKGQDYCQEECGCETR